MISVAGPVICFAPKADNQVVPKAGEYAVVTNVRLTSVSRWSRVTCYACASGPIGATFRLLV
jgi:hypothetical protein